MPAYWVVCFAIEEVTHITQNGDATVHLQAELIAVKRILGCFKEAVRLSFITAEFNNYAFKH